MSQRLISRSGDLSQLRAEGYELEVRNGFLLLDHVPYVNAAREVRYGSLVSNLELAGDVTVKPENHVVYMTGEMPCDHRGQALMKVINSSGRQQLAPDVEIDHMFSTKPSAGYADYHEKMTTHVRILAAQAQAIEPNATATTFPVVADDDEESVFRYIDTATGRAGIGAASERLKTGPIGIIGLGGTGAYLLDLVSKTPVESIHLFDGDRFAQHNAFRAPGGTSIEDLAERPQKVHYFARQYSKIHRGIVPHDCYLAEDNLSQLERLSFVFIAIDRNEPKRAIVEKLEAEKIPFIDVGMGIRSVDGALAGLLRITTSTPSQRAHVKEKRRIPYAPGSDDDEYAANIQIADLNALNATLAVLRWKKLLGFYSDIGGEHNSIFATSDACLINEDFA